MIVLDANVLLRYLTQDNADMAARARTVVDALGARERTAFLPEGVIVEVVQVLSSKNLYDVERTQIRTDVEALLQLDGLRTSAKQTHLRALSLFAEVPALSFVDALCVAYAERDEPSVVVSFDREFRRVSSITWEQP